MSEVPEASDIRQAREEAGLSVIDAAAIVGVSRRAWHYWETNDRRMPVAAWRLFKQQAGRKAKRIHDDDPNRKT